MGFCFIWRWVDNGGHLGGFNSYIKSYFRRMKAMSYSRWGGRGSGFWYTYWRCASDEAEENRDTALFDICSVVAFTAKDLREDLKSCLAIAAKKAPDGDIHELKSYVKEFLGDVDLAYPSKDLKAENERLGAALKQVGSGLLFFNPDRPMTKLERLAEEIVAIRTFANKELEEK
jgi:hypothetical protein